ncbi:hypothetical protein BDV10DRAFT_177781 [Aspergillus recurvatus]
MFKMRSLRSGLLARRSWICMQCRQYNSSTPAISHGKKSKLPSMPARTRFAPSPTGYLHLGSLRTALYNYLLAKRTNGKFILRIEDTDQKRTIPDAEQRLYDDLQWAGLQWDEGPIVGGDYGPYRQSERTEIHQKYAEKLIQRGHAYRCFCSPERLDTHARHRSQAGLPPGYDRKCANLLPAHSEERAALGESHVIRLRVEDYPYRYPVYDDLVYGETGHKGPPTKLDLIDRVYDDPILIKSDGYPTYHLANVVDDHLMGITHVIRGTEWMSSTPLHVLLYKCFGWKAPRFAHVPLLVDHSGQKLSKRNADIDLSHFRDQGIFPEPLLNFAALLGWSHKEKNDIFDLKKLEHRFTLKFTRGNTTVAFEKLWFLQSAHVKRYVDGNMPQVNEMISAVAKVVESTASPEQLSQVLQSRSLVDMITPLIKADAKNYTNPKEFVARNSTFFTTAISRPPYDRAVKQFEIPFSSLHTAAAAVTLVPRSHWTLETLKANFTTYDAASAVLEETEIVDAEKKFKKELYHYLRWALSAGASGPTVPEIMIILGREETLRRLEESRKLTTENGAVSPVAARLMKEKGLEPKAGLAKEAKTKGHSWTTHSSLPSAS